VPDSLVPRALHERGWSLPGLTFAATSQSWFIFSMPNRPTPSAPDRAWTDLAIHTFSVALVLLVLWVPGAVAWLLILAVPAYVIRCLWKAWKALAKMERLLP